MLFCKSMDNDICGFREMNVNMAVLFLISSLLFMGTGCYGSHQRVTGNSGLRYLWGASAIFNKAH